MFQLEMFQQPEARYGIHPFWFWNGDMEDKEIIRQIEEMAAKGLGGFFICPRQGLKIPYLSDAWFQKVKLAVEKAEELGLEVWLYDEYPYPSGIAGGEVTLLHPEAKHYILVHRTASVSAGKTCSLELPWGRVLYAKAVPIDPSSGKRDWSKAVDIRGAIGNHQAEPVFQKAGLTAYNQKRFFTYNTIKKLLWTAPEGDWEVQEWEVHCFLEEEVRDFKYYGHYVDPLNEEAMRTFIELTHKRYAEHLGEYFGKTIKGMFTDEIGLLGKIPWSPRLLQVFRERNGYDLADHMHALLYDDDEDTAKIRYDYYQTIHEQLVKAYHKQVYDWCEQHGLLYTAEVPAVRMNTQRYSHVPGGDSGHEKLGRSLEWILDRYSYSLRYNPKMASSIANQLGRERALVECFHSVGWSMTLQDAKWMIDRLAALGVNFFNFHAFFYTLDGLTKHDAPPSHFLQNSYWRYFDRLSSYVRRISYVMSTGKPVRPIAVLDPTTTFWVHLGNPFFEFSYSGHSEAEKQRLESLKEQWREICKTLTMNQRDFDHLDPEVLLDAKVADGRLQIGQAAYEAVIIPPITNLETPAWRKLREFLAQGGKVIACWELPSQSLDGTSEVVREMAEIFAGEEAAMQREGKKGARQMGAYRVESSEELLALVEELLPQDLRFEVEDRSAFLMHQRMLDDHISCVFITNQEAGQHEAKLILKGYDPAGTQIYRLCLESGDCERLAVEKSEDHLVLRMKFGAYESHLFLIQRQAADSKEFSEQMDALPVEKLPPPSDVTAAASVNEDTPEVWTWELDAKEAWQIQAERDNVLRLDSFELRTSYLDGRPLQEQGVKVQAKTFIDQCADIADMHNIPLEFHQIFGTPMKLKAAYPLRATYTTSFIADYVPDRCWLLMDHGAILGEWSIGLNGRTITKEQLEETFVYDHMNRCADISGFIQVGINTMTVQVKIEQDWHGVVDALYICGDFGICEDQGQPLICKAPQFAAFTAAPIEGFPYYAGTLLLKREAVLDELPESTRFSVRFRDLDESFHDCAEIIVNGHSLGVRPWTPYEWQGSTELLRRGVNIVEVRITNTLIGMLEGRKFDYAKHTLVPAVGDQA